MQGLRTVTGEGLNSLGWCYTVVLQMGITKTQMKYLGFQLEHHPTSFVWLLVVVEFAWDLYKE